MRRSMSLAKALGLISLESQEKLATKLLTVETVRDHATKAALKGLLSCRILIGPCSLAHTHAMRELEAKLKGLTFVWEDERTKTGEIVFYLKVIWTLAGDGTTQPVAVTDYNRPSADMEPEEP
jgi:hypothetical protein